MKVGILGLGKMGSRIANKLHNGGHEVIGWNRTPHKEKFKTAKSIQELVQNLSKPRVLWLMLPHGNPTDEILSEVLKYIQKNDIVIDGGNAYYKDTEKRSKRLSSKGVLFLGIGVSGGVHGEKNGFALMAGGKKSAYDHVRPLLKTLSEPEGSYAYFGEGGAGHFVKMVHNGIEYGMMQSIGEGFDVLKNSPYKLNLSKVAEVYSKGTIISGFLMDRTADVLLKDQGLNKIVGSIEATGEAEWTVNAAKEEKVQTEIIKRSLGFRRKSKTDKKVQNSFTAKIIASLRNAFGGHEVKKK